MLNLTGLSDFEVTDLRKLFLFSGFQVRVIAVLGYMYYFIENRFLIYDRLVDWFTIAPFKHTVYRGTLKFRHDLCPKC